VRNLLILRSTQGTPDRGTLLARLVDEPPERLSRLEEQAQRCLPQEWLVFLQVLTGAYDLIRRSPLAATILELAALKLATREEWQSLAEIARRLEQLGAGPSAGPEEPALAPVPRVASRTVAVPPPGALEPAVLPSAPAAAAEEAQTPVPPIPEDLATMWPVFLERLGEQKMSLAAYLAHARPLQHQGAVLTVGLPAFALHQEVLSLTDNHRLIERLLSELCGTRTTVQYTTVAEEVAPPAPSAGGASATSSLVQDIVSLFNATRTDQSPRPT
jgi:hypothetical protein